MWRAAFAGMNVAVIASPALKVSRAIPSLIIVVGEDAPRSTSRGAAAVLHVPDDEHMRVPPDDARYHAVIGDQLARRGVVACPAVMRRRDDAEEKGHRDYRERNCRQARGSCSTS